MHYSTDAVAVLVRVCTFFIYIYLCVWCVCVYVRVRMRLCSLACASASSVKINARKAAFFQPNHLTPIRASVVIPGIVLLDPSPMEDLPLIP